MSQKNGVTPEFLARFTQAWNDKDLDTLMDHMADDCTFMASVGTEVEGSLWVGRESVREGFSSLWIGYPDAHFEPVGEDIIVGNRGLFRVGIYRNKSRKWYPRKSPRLRHLYI